jgi:hypothetical protein
MASLVALLGQVSHLCPAHNEAHVPREQLRHVAEAFERIAAGPVPFDVEEGIRVYRFEGFGLTLPQD